MKNASSNHLPSSPNTKKTEIRSLLRYLQFHAKCFLPITSPFHHQPATERNIITAALYTVSCKMIPTNTSRLHPTQNQLSVMWSLLHCLLFHAKCFPRITSPLHTTPAKKRKIITAALLSFPCTIPQAIISPLHPAQTNMINKYSASLLTVPCTMLQHITTPLQPTPPNKSNMISAALLTDPCKMIPTINFALHTAPNQLTVLWSLRHCLQSHAQCFPQSPYFLTPPNKLTVIFPLLYCLLFHA